MFSVSLALHDHQAAINSAFDVIWIIYVHVILIADILNQMKEEILNCYSYN